MQWLRAYWPLMGFLVVIAALIAAYVFVTPEEIVESIGVSNTYAVAFALAALGGISSLTGVAFYSSIAAFAAGGADPLYLALAGGVGLFISDTVFYLLASYGHRSLPERWRMRLDRLFAWVRSNPPSLVLAASYVYLGILPLPSDILMLVLVLSGYRYRKVAPVLLASGITMAFIASTLGNAVL